MKRIITSLIVGISGVLIAIAILTLVGSTKSNGFQFSYQASALTNREQSNYAQNNILFYDDTCIPSGNANFNSSYSIGGNGFKIDGSVSAIDFWYAEGCINIGECTSGIYADPSAFTGPNPMIYSDTKIDPDFGGMQYIYAENYDINYDVWPPKFTEKTGPKSNRKYYWIVLPTEAYSNGLGEIYIAKFENLSEPVYFITLDTHACQHQNEHYCEKAKADPNNVMIGKEFLGAFTQQGGGYDAVAKITGKLTYFHRISGAGEVVARETAEAPSSGLSTTSSSSTASSSSDASSSSTTPSSSDSSSSSSSSNSSNSSNTTTSASNSCAKLGQDRTAMWNEASQADKNSFMSIVNQENHYISGVEGFMNQALWYSYSNNNNKNILNYWLTGGAGGSTGCPGFRGGASCSDGSYSISDYDQGLINEALAGSNNIRFANGNATGGSNVSAGKLTCVWDGKKCRDDIEYYSENYMTPCGSYTSNPNEECWGYDVDPAGVEKWVNENYSDCGGDCSLSAVEIPSYGQCSAEWGSHSYPYSDGKTVCDGGCGPASLAMLTTVLTGQTVTPVDIIDLTSSKGYYPNSDVGYEMTQIVAEKYNLEAEKIAYSSKQDAYDKMKKYLNDGYVIHLSGEGSHPGFSNSNTSGHYIGLVSIDSDDKVRVANSNSVGNNTTDLQNIADAIHNGSFVILKSKGGNNLSCNNNGSNSNGVLDDCDTGGSSGLSNSSTTAGNIATTECGKKVLNSAQKIIGIASQYGFDYSQEYHDISSQFDEILKGKSFKTDCTGFASFVMYDAFGVKQVFYTGDIASNPNYKEIPKSQVQIGDIFNYNYGCTAHGGIITKIENGKITEIAQTGRPEYLTSGTSSLNGRLGYSYYPNLDNGNLNCVNDASDVKYYRYKECN